MVTCAIADEAATETIAALITAARERADKPTLLLAHGRMALPALRGVHHPNLLPAPDFVLRDTENLQHAMQDYRDSVTLVNFWASWCPPCVEKIPSMNRLAARYAPADFRIVSINFRESSQHIRDFMRQVDVGFPVLIDADGLVSQDWRVFAFPSSFLVDRAGCVRHSVNSAIAWDEPAIIELIDGLVAE
ncbi:MAG: TlpA disulfide reductase family protein [Thiohalocapsa sp.]